MLNQDLILSVSGVLELNIEINCLFWLFFSGVTVLLALTVFNTMVTEILPKVSDALPILG